MLHATMQAQRDGQLVVVPQGNPLVDTSLNDWRGS